MDLKQVRISLTANTIIRPALDLVSSPLFPGYLALEIRESESTASLSILPLYFPFPESQATTLLLQTKLLCPPERNHDKLLHLGVWKVPVRPIQPLPNLDSGVVLLPVPMAYACRKYEDDRNTPAASL
jgi:hypothetical protein